MTKTEENMLSNILFWAKRAGFTSERLENYRNKMIKDGTIHVEFFKWQEANPHLKKV